MTFNEAEEFWRGELDAIKADKDGDGTACIMVSINMIEAALKAFEARREYMADCEILKLKKELQNKPTPHDYVATMINFLDGSESERAEATFNVDDYRVTIIAVRKKDYKEVLKSNGTI